MPNARGQGKDGGACHVQKTWPLPGIQGTDIPAWPDLQADQNFVSHAREQGRDRGPTSLLHVALFRPGAC